VKKSVSKRFQQRLRQLRKQHGLTQERAAEVCGVGYKLYQLYELGIKQNPGLLTLDKIAAGYGLDVSELLSPKIPKSRLSR
jgi:transcriptional regulator with XRE-family HTH domain